ncbi:MAG: hypothetical protein OMM_02299 [Candidatus Magnetoglobus multicellularis str. Araruama]|uniref:Uncharacterized protein n=1 Tax=Candidatus Magnetoglobus multicellularis str. Araruama TaxID=890399 RepID=A0A1V1P9X5_9BACT|nr:MAG: hypothetical protein OMM_02299 [Candidatus Magnetoglobus multicellularis str. Araruama]
MRYLFIIILICSSVADAGGLPTYDCIAMLQRLRAAVRQLRSYQLQLEQYRTNLEDIKRRAKNLDELRLNLKKKGGLTKKDLENADKLLTGVIDHHEKTERLYDDVLTLKKNTVNTIKTGVNKIVGNVRKKAENISKQALSDEIKKGRKSLSSMDGIDSNLKMLNEAATKAKGSLQINQVIAMTNQQIAGLIKILTTVISAQAETVQAEKVKKHAKNSEAKENSDRFFNSQKAVCNPKRKLTKIPYPNGYELKNPYEW